MPACYHVWRPIYIDYSLNASICKHTWASWHVIPMGSMCLHCSALWLCSSFTWPLLVFSPQIKGGCDSWSPGRAVINNLHSLHFPSLARMSVSLSFHPTLSKHLCAVINVTCISKHNVFTANTLLVDKLGYSAHSDSQLASLTNRAVNWSQSLVLSKQSCSSQNTE